MIEKLIENMTNKEDFIEGINSNRVGITKIDNNTFNLFDATFNRLDYTLTKLDNNNYILSHKDDYENFTAYLNIVNNVTTIEKANINGRNYKSAKHLKKFYNLMIFANCFVNFGLLN